MTSETSGRGRGPCPLRFKKKKKSSSSPLLYYQIIIIIIIIIIIMSKLYIMLPWILIQSSQTKMLQELEIWEYLKVLCPFSFLLNTRSLLPPKKHKGKKSRTTKETRGPRGPHKIKPGFNNLLHSINKMPTWSSEIEIGLVYYGQHYQKPI